MRSDIFEGSHVIEARTTELVDEARSELDEVLSLGGAFAAIEMLKARLVTSNTERTRAIESGDQVVVGVNTHTESAPSPLGSGDQILTVDPSVQTEMIADVREWRSTRDDVAVKRALERLHSVANSAENIMEATIELAQVGGTTGEWAGVLREVFGEYRAPTGVGPAVDAMSGSESLRDIARRVRELEGGPPRILVAKPGLDGHSNGAEQIAVAARDAGMEVIYQGIRLTPEQIVATARDEDVDLVGLSILSGSHLELVPEIMRLMAADGIEAPVVVGGIIPTDDRARLIDVGVSAVYSPKDFELARIMDEIVDLVEAARHG